jgi:hypothetical protein
MALRISKRGLWATSNPTFGRCPACSGLTLRGVCQSCGLVHACAHCGRVKLPDGTYAAVRHDSEQISHGICRPCAQKYHPDTYNRLVAKGVWKGCAERV